MEYGTDTTFYGEEVCVVNKKIFFDFIDEDQLKTKQKLLSHLGLPLDEFALCHGGSNYINHMYCLDAESYEIIPPCGAYINSLLLWFQIWLLTTNDLAFIDEKSITSVVSLSCTNSTKHFRYQNQKHLVRLCLCCVSQEDEESQIESKNKDCFVSLCSKRTALIHCSGYLQGILKEITSNNKKNVVYSNLSKRVFSCWADIVLKKLFRFTFGTGRPNNPAPQSMDMISDGSVNINSYVTFDTCDSMDVGVYLKPNRTLAPHSLIMSIGEEEAINLYTILSNEEFRPLALHLLFSGDEKYSEDMILLLYLIWDRFCHKKPIHQKYYDSVTTFGEEKTYNLLLAPPEVMQFLDIPELYEIRDSLNARLNSIYDACITELTFKFPQILNPFWLTWERFIWARWLIDTRAFLFEIPPPDGLMHLILEYAQSMLPIESCDSEEARHPVVLPKRLTTLLRCADKFNHHRLVAACGLPKFNTELRCFEIRNEFLLTNFGTAPLQIYMMYGPFESWQLLMYYGFCPTRGSPKATLNNSHYLSLMNTNTDTLTLNLIIDESSDARDNRLFCLRDTDSGSLTLTTCLKELIERNFDSLDSGLNALTQPLVEHAIQKIQFLQDQMMLPQAIQDFWVSSWGDRLVNFFSMRLAFLLKHIGIQLFPGETFSEEKEMNTEEF